MVKTSSSSATQKRKPRILWANPFCLLDSSSGASMTARQMLLQLVAHGYDVQVLGATVFDNTKGMGMLKEQFPDLNAHLHQLIEAEDGPITHQLVVSYSHNRNHFTTHEEGLWYSQYLYMLDSFKPDVVCFYGGQTLDLLIADEARDRGIPVAFYLANGNYKSPRWCRDVDLILTDSQATADMYRKAVGYIAKPIGKFIAPGSFVAEHHERKRLLFVNPSWQKGANVFVQLAVKLEQERPDIELEVVEARADWASVLRDTTHRMGKQRGSLGNVTVTANTSDMRGPYSRARVLVAPSLWWESSGRVLAEAMLNGIPALITNRGGMPEMIGNAGITFDFPHACYEEPYQYLLSDEDLQPLVDAVISFFDDEDLYQDYVTRAWQVGKEKHHLDRATDRLLTALTPLVGLRAGNKDFAITQKKRHRQRLASRAAKPEFKVDNSLQQLVGVKPETQQGNKEQQASRLSLTDNFSWQINGKIMVLDNRASLIKCGLADQMAATEAFGIVAFDPASEIKDAKQYEGSEYIQLFQHALLGDGKAATLNACVAPEMSSILAPLSVEKLPKRHHLGAKPLAELPITTVALDSIDGLGNLDWLILDELSDAMAVLEHGKKTLANTLLIQARVAFQFTHEKQPNLAELQHWASRNGFRFYRFHNISHYSHLPEKLSAQTACATEQESGDVLFLPSHERMATLSDKERTKLAFILSAGFAAHDVAFELLADVSNDKALEFLEGQELLPKAPVTQDAVNKDVLVPHSKNQLTNGREKPSLPPEAIIAPQAESQCQIDLEFLKEQLFEVLNHLAIFELTQSYAVKVVELSEKMRWVDDKAFVEKAIDKIHREYSKKKDSIPLFYLLTNSLLNSHAEMADCKSLNLLEEKLDASGWRHKAPLYSFWLENILDNRVSPQSKEFAVIIICNKYKRETYENIIELRHQCGASGEIIFVNNGDKSNDARGLAPLVDVYVELNGNSGAYLARNIGAVFADGDVLIFVDDDGLPEEGMLSAHADVHKKYTLDAVRGSYLPKNPNEIPPGHYHLGDKPLVALNCLEGNCSYRRDLFFKMSGWGDYILFGHGGAELYVRMISSGSDQSKHVYIPGCILRHDYYRGEKHAKNKRKKQAESAYILSALDCAINPTVSGFLSNEINKDFSEDDNYARKSAISRFVCIEYPLIYGIKLSDKGIGLGLDKSGLEKKVVEHSKDIISEIMLANKSDVIFTGHSFYNLTIKSPPYIQEDKNVFDVINVVPFSIVDDHSYADFMLQRCKKAPQEIIMGSTSFDLLDEFEVVSISKKVHKIKVPSKSPEVDNILFEEKQNRAVFLGKLYENVPADKASLRNKVLSESRLSKEDKARIIKMINERESNPFYSLPLNDLNVNELSLLYYDLVDKFFRNFYRDQELGRIASAFHKQGIPVHVIGGEASSWSFKCKQDCIFWPKMAYKEAISFLHDSKYNINLTPSYSDILTGRAIDMMGSNALCVSDYSPYYEKLDKESIYFGSKFIDSNDFCEENNSNLARVQRDYIYTLFDEGEIAKDWKACIEKVCEIIGKKNASTKRNEIEVNESSVKTKKMLNDPRSEEIKEIHIAEINRLKDKEKIRVIFLAIHRSAWKVDAVFQQMLHDPAFEPVILVCPDFNKKNDELTFLEMSETYSYFKEKGYSVFSSWMKSKKQWRSLDSLKPDLLFFTNPHGLTHPEYYDRAYTRFLTCYVPYTYQVAKYNSEYQLDYNQAFHNLAWKIYAPHNQSLDISRCHADNKGSNVLVTGYPLIEDLIDLGGNVKVWKYQGVEKKKIIWAPHHSVESETLPFSTFKKFAEFMIEIAEIYQEEVQWAFKPHPLLKEKLYLSPEWDKETADNYYSYWSCSQHTQLEEGGYEDLFKTSDALIHDSVSFLAEYLVLDKPVMFLVNENVEIRDFLTPFGLRAFDASGQGKGEGDIRKFIDLIIGEENPGKEKRDCFIKNYCELFENDLPSKKIVQDIKESLGF